MPSVSKAQQQFMGSELRRKRAGKKTKTDMSARELKDFAATDTMDLPERAEGYTNQKKKSSVAAKKKKRM
jgi:hypothetical protein